MESKSISEPSPRTFRSTIKNPETRDDALDLQKPSSSFRAQQLTGICFWDDRQYEEVVVMPSITETAQALARTKGISYYEHRQLYHVALLRDPSIKRLIFLSSIPVDAVVVRYYWELLLKDFIPFSSLAERFVPLSLNDPTVRPLSDKICDSPCFLSKVRETIQNKARCCLIPFVSTPAEHKVAEMLGVTILSHHPRHYTHGTKAGACKIFQKAHVPYPFGTELVRTEEDLAAAVFELWRRGALEEREKGVHQWVEECSTEQHMDRFVVKLDDSASGGGNALFDMRSVLARCSLLEARNNQALATTSRRTIFEAWFLTHRERITEEIVREFPRMAFQGRDESWPTYRTEIPTQAPHSLHSPPPRPPPGVHVELFIDHQFAPSCQGVISTEGDVTILSTHEQILDGHVYQGCKFPCNHAYRKRIQEYTLKVGRILAHKGAIGHFGVDFLASRTMPAAAYLTNPDSCDPNQEWELFAVEINLRQSGTTHPMMLAKLLTQGEYDSNTGMLISSTGDPKYYVANDNIISPLYTALSPASLVAGVLADDVHYCPKRQTGVMFHLLGPVQEMGKVGIVCVGNTRQEADDYAVRARKLLDHLATFEAAASLHTAAGFPSLTSPCSSTTPQQPW